MNLTPVVAEPIGWYTGAFIAVAITIVLLVLASTSLSDNEGPTKHPKAWLTGAAVFTAALTLGGISTFQTITTEATRSQQIQDQIQQLRDGHNLSDLAVANMKKKPICPTEKPVGTTVEREAHWDGLAHSGTLAIMTQNDGTCQVLLRREDRTVVTPIR